MDLRKARASPILAGINSYWKLLGVLSALVLCASCPGPHRAEILQLMKIHPENERVRVFNSYSYSKQIDIYLEAMNGEPPLLGFATYVAANRDAILPTLLNRIRTAPDDRTRQELLYVLEKMAKFFMPLRDRDDVVKTAKEATSQIRDPLYRERAEASLKVILGAGPFVKVSHE